jgi:hypothetical protein
MNPAMADLILTSNGSAEEDYDVTSEGRLVGHIFKPAAAPVETPWMWAFVHSRPEDRFPAPHGYAATREARCRLLQASGMGEALLTLLLPIP